MSNISFQIVKPGDTGLIELIAGWYVSEWNISREVTIQRISNFPPSGVPFQMVMKVDDSIVSTGGLYSHVGLLDREPRFTIFHPWLALVYTVIEHRNKGYGTLLCEKIQSLSENLGLKEIFLFTHTAESFYKRLGWQPLERIESNGKKVVVMKKEL